MKIEFPNSEIFGYLKSDGILSEGSDIVFSKLKVALEGRVEAAYVFGSFARGEQREFSDLDILVYTPEEFNKSISNPALGFWSEVVKDIARIL